ncbi:MAG: hypothetical protein VZS12_01685 [Ruminococcus bromii]|nr:hypothetical protein [Ruminococcus bromii]
MKSRIKLSDKTYFGYTLSLAQLSMLSFMPENEREKICYFVTECLTNHLGKNRLKQLLFDNNCKVDNYLFSDLVYCFTVGEEKEIMEEWYVGFNDEKDFESRKTDCYLSLYPKLYEKIKKRREWLNNL